MFSWRHISTRQTAQFMMTSLRAANASNKNKSIAIRDSVSACSFQLQFSATVFSSSFAVIVYGLLVTGVTVTVSVVSGF